MPVTHHIQVIGGSETQLTAGHSLTINRVTGAASTCTFVVQAAADSAPAWPYGTQVAVVRKGIDGTERLFRGTVTAARSSANGTDECHIYTVSDAWWHLEREVMKADRTVIDASTGLSATLSTPRLLLFRSPDGTTATTAAAAITAAVAWAASKGIAIQAGTITAPVQPPCDEVNDRSCAEIIQRALRWQPDAVAWLDHATEPPSLNVTRRSAMAAGSIAFADLDSCDITPRGDLTVPGVEIAFEYTDAPGRTVAVRTAGTPTAAGCARMTLSLDRDGGIPGQEQEIKTVALGDYTASSWWQRMFPWLPNDAEIADATILPTPGAGFDKILTAGQITQWMRDDYDLDVGRYTVSCRALSFSVDGHAYSEKDLTRTFTLTNASTKRYISRTRAGWREPIPENLASDFYASASLLWHEGTVTLTEPDCLAGRALIGKTLNVTGGLAAWATMAVPVSSVTERLDTGQTQITFGPQPHLGPRDLIEIIRAGRFRTRLTIQTIPDDPPEEEEIDPFSPEELPSASPGQLEGLDIIYEEA